jgi:hypothetical protein
MTPRDRIGQITSWVVVAFLTLSVSLVFALLLYGFVSDWMPVDRPNAFACTNASLVTVDAEVAPDRDGRIVERDFLGCTVWWYGI